MTINRTNLVYVSPEPERQGHASYTHVHEIIRGLRGLDWQVDLYCPRYDEASRLPGALARLAGIGRAMWRAISAPRGDVYYMRWHFAAFPVALWAHWKKVPFVIEVNGPVEDLFIAWPVTRKAEGLFRWLMESQLRWASGVVAVTEGLAASVRSVKGDGARVQVIPNAANTDQFTPDAAKQENAHTKALPERFMVFFGTMARWQGIRAVLGATEDPAWPDGIHAVFVGDGAEREHVETVARNVDHVHYPGRVPYADLPAIVARAMGSFVCTEDTSGRAMSGLAPLKLFESLAAGVPVISTDMPYQADIVRESASGYIVSAGDSHAIAEAVARLAGDGEERMKMARNARKCAEVDHSWKARARDTHDLLVEVLETANDA